MAEVIAPYALTTQQRMKDRLAITGVNLDILLDRIISAATDIIESYCGRRFRQTPYTDEIYSVDRGVKYIFLKQIPVTAFTRIQYRAGTPTAPNWLDFPPNSFELEGDGTRGIIRIYGGAPSGVNRVRVTYTAGYLINFAQAGTAAHTLPFDLTEVCERLTTKILKKKDAEGRKNEGFEGGTITWGALLDDDDKKILNNYRHRVFL